MRLADQFGVVGMRNLARAGTRAALDLVEQARARAVLVIGIGAGPQQERALQGVQCPVYGPDARERSEIIAFAAARPAMFRDLRRGVIAREQNVGKMICRRASAR